MDNRAKYKKQLFLHILTKKCSTSVLLKLCKNVYISTRATITVEIYTANVACPFIILFISRSLPFFSLFSVLNKLNKLSNFSFPHLLLFPQMHTNTPTHKHIHTEKSTQRYTCSKKKRKKEIHKHTHTNKPKHTNNKDTDQCLSKRSVFDRCLIGTIRAHGSCLIEASGSRLIRARGYGSCLIGARQIDACGSEPDRSCGSVLVTGVVDRCF